MTIADTACTVGPVRRGVGDSARRATAADVASGVALVVGGLLCLAPFVGSAGALVVGVVFAQLGLNRWARQTRWAGKKLLTASVVGLGAGLDFHAMAQVGMTGATLAVASIVFCLTAGVLLARALRVDPITGLLVAAGTAICGGSAIAAVGPTVRAREHQLAAALGTVFLLNAVALLIFPAVGELLGLGSRAFGLWCALAIHDTSSVVGAAMAHGSEALEIATTVKLARALWIVPLTAGLAWRTRRSLSRGVEGANSQHDAPRAARPWFILGFVALAVAVNAAPAFAPVGEVVSELSRRALVVTLFFVGASLDRETFRRTGPRPLLQGLALWALVSASTLAVILRVV